MPAAASGSPVRTAVIPAAGLGTRLLPASKSQPKEMMPVVDKPAIQYAVEEAAAAGIDDVLIITSRGKETMADHFDRTSELEDALEAKGRSADAQAIRQVSELAQVHFVRQHEALGLGHAVAVARRHVGDQPFAVLLPDDLLESPAGLSAMIAAHAEHGGSIIGLMQATPEELTQLGCIRGEPVAERLHRVLDIVEKPPLGEAPSDLSVVGRYVFTPQIFDAIDATEPGVGGEIQLTDAIGILNRSQPVLGYDLPVRRFDMGKKLDYLKTIVEVALTHPELADDFRSYLAEVADREGLVS
jgi:UTP--glucose-1-phosphate uridylyltransferase